MEHRLPSKLRVRIIINREKYLATWHQQKEKNETTKSAKEKSEM